jgi:DNA-directed RNA polymerase subunit K
MVKEKKEYTRFERARIIGARALQLAKGAIPMVKVKIGDPIKIAQIELEKGVIPLDVRRKLPKKANG